MLNSGNGGQRAQQGSEREHDGQREEAAGRSQLQQLRIGSRGIAQIEFSMDSTPLASGGGSGAAEPGSSRCSTGGGRVSAQPTERKLREHIAQHGGQGRGQEGAQTLERGRRSDLLHSAGRARRRRRLLMG